MRNNEIDRVMEDRGFLYAETGGGCDCYQHELSNGMFLLITDGEAKVPTDEDAPAGLYLLSSSGDAVMSRTFSSLKELVHCLKF